MSSRSHWKVVGRRLATVASLVASITLLIVAVRGPTNAANLPGPERDEAVARIERAGGHVGIDGEAEDQPVWMVDLSDVAVTDATLDLLRAFPKLEVLQLHQTGLEDAQLTKLAELRSLRELSLSDTRITDAGLKHLRPLQRLEQLSLHGTRVTDAGLQYLVPLRNLKDILHAETAITDEGLAAFHAARLAQSPDKNSPPQVVAGPATVPQIEAALADSLHATGRALFTASRNDPQRRREAVVLLEQALRADPGNERLQLDLADAYLLLDHELTITYAIELYEQVLRRRPTATGLYGRLAEAYAQLGNYDAAFALAAARGAAEPMEPFPAAAQLADLAAASGDLQRGIAELQTLTKLTQHQPGVQLLLAALLREAGQPREARQIAESILPLVAVDSPFAIEARRLLEGK